AARRERPRHGGRRGRGDVRMEGGNARDPSRALRRSAAAGELSRRARVARGGGLAGCAGGGSIAGGGRSAAVVAVPAGGPCPEGEVLRRRSLVRGGGFARPLPVRLVLQLVLPLVSPGDRHAGSHRGARAGADGAGGPRRRGRDVAGEAGTGPGAAMVRRLRPRLFLADARRPRARLR